MTSWVVALHTVFDTADPVTLCWAAVIRSVMLCPDIFAHSTWQQHTHKKNPHSHTLTHSQNWTLGEVEPRLGFVFVSKKRKEKRKRKPPPTSATFCRTPLPPNSLSPHLSLPSSVGMNRAARLWQTETRGGRNKEELSPTTTTVTDKCGECFFCVGSGSFRWSPGRRGSGIRSLTHPTRVSASLSSRCGTPVPCLPPPLRQSSPLLLLQPPLLPPPPPPAAAAAARL